MKIDANSPDEYIDKIPQERKTTFSRLRSVINDNIPEGFEETMNYGMIGYVIPHSLYPGGYHCDPSLPLPFMNLASQKNFIALYHMGIYADKELLGWFQDEYKKRVGKKPDMGKSCIRFKNPEQIPFELIAELAGKMTAEEWIYIYESNIKR